MGFVLQQVELCIFRCVASATHFFSEGENVMADYKKMYIDLFNSVTDAINILQEAQERAEEKFVESSEKEGEKIKLVEAQNE